MLVAFTIEVFLAIVHPVIHKVYVSRQLVAKVVFVVCLTALTYYTGLNIGIAKVFDNLCYTTYSWSFVNG
jgi:hypothetical protein